MASDLQIQHEAGDVKNGIVISNTHICRIKGCGGAGWPPHQ